MSNTHNQELLEQLYEKYLDDGYTPIVAEELAKRDFEQMSD